MLVQTFPRSLIEATLSWFTKVGMTKSNYGWIWPDCLLRNTGSTPRLCITEKAYYREEL